MVCGQCAALLCDHCTNIRVVGKTRVRFCGVCGGMCRGLASGQRETGRAPATSFGAAIGRAFSYPFQGNGTMMIAGATVLFAFAEIVPGGFLLGMAMFDNMAALDPRLVIPSILRVPGAYLVVCAIFFGTFAASSLGDSWLFARMRLVSLTLGQFLAIYLAMVATRVLGLLYFTNRDRLNWLNTR